jgi:hypothetical protein
MSNNTLLSAIGDCLDLIEVTVNSGHSFKAILSKRRKNGYNKVSLTPYIDGDNLQVKIVSSTKTQDFTSNITLEEVGSYLLDQLSNQFMFLDIFGDGVSLHVKQSKKGKITLLKQKVVKALGDLQQHNRTKNYLIPTDAPFLSALGIANKEGKILSQQTRKYRQINKFIEIIDKLIDGKSVKRISDMGSGKVYLTFALYWYLTQKSPSNDLTVIGYELRKDLIEKSNSTAGSLGYKGLKFVEGHIGQIEMDDVDLLIALHACDIATDMAIHQGIKSNAGYIVLSPCCHKQVRKAMTKKDLITSHGIYQERTAEMVTDTIRGLLLESEGYRTSIFEFISSEHTAKNIMITAEKGEVNETA